jgi:hypothetical protein
MARACCVVVAGWAIPCLNKTSKKRPKKRPHGARAAHSSAECTVVKAGEVIRLLGDVWANEQQLLKLLNAARWPATKKEGN